MTSLQNNKIDLGFNAHQKGDYKTALQLYNEALLSEPDNAEAISLKGSVLSLQGNSLEAEVFLRQAVDLEPETEGFWLNLADHFIRNKQPIVACEILVGNIDKSSAYLPVWQCLYKAAMQAGNTEYAIIGLENLLQANYNFKTLISLSQLLVGQKQLNKAIDYLTTYEQKAQSERTYWFALCWLLDSTRQWQSLVEAAKKWLAFYNNDTDGYRYLASAKFEIGKQHDAITIFEKILDLPILSGEDKEKRKEDSAKYAELCVASLELEKAEWAIEKAVQADVKTPGLLNAQAQLAIFSGDSDRAIFICKQSLKSFPDYFPIYSQLARVAPKKITKVQCEKLRKYVQDNNAESDSMAFVLAHHYHAKQNYKEASHYYQMANKLRAEKNTGRGAVYELDSANQFYENVVDQFFNTLKGLQKEFIHINDDYAPIFVLGMPRSGTTLLEGLLSTHPQITKTGERIELPNLMHSILNGSIPQESILDVLKTFRADFISRGQGSAASESYFIDKNPSNYMTIGLITVLFPKALIVNLEREPMETMLSIYRHEFSHLWSFATSLKDIAHQYEIYRKFISTWKQSNSLLVTMTYEDMVADPNAAIGTLLAKLNLEISHENFEEGLSRQSSPHLVRCKYEIK